MLKKKANKKPFSIVAPDDEMQEKMAAMKGKGKGKTRAVPPKTKLVTKKKAKKHTY